MANPREDSVLMNLRLLKGISEDRAEEEREQLRLRAEQARQALAEAERLRRLDAERIVRQADEARQRAADDAARCEREAQLRLEEAERRARVEAAARLEEARLRLEIEARAAQGADKRPVGWIVAALLLLAGAGGAGVYLYQQGQRAEAATRAAQQRVIELQAINADIKAKRDEALTAGRARREQIERDIAARERELEALQAGGAKPPAPVSKPPASRPTPARPAVPDTHIKMCPPEKPICQEWEKR